jgi:uncharacterized protein
MQLSRLLKQVVWVLLLAVLLLGVPRLAGLFADQFDYSAIDPDGAFAWISVHHIAQTVVFLVLMLAISNLSNIRFGFRWGDSRIGLYYVRLFALIFSGYAVVSLIIAATVGTFQPPPFPLTARNVVGQLGFQLLLSGPSEELIFRAFGITMLALMIRGALFRGEQGVSLAVRTVFGKELTHANIIAAIIFGLAHVRFEFAPFSVSFHTFQVIYATMLGLFYGTCYERSGSMYYPMMMHSITNVVAVSVAIIAVLIIG